jgi:hypothetical protein
MNTSVRETVCDGSDAASMNGVKASEFVKEFLARWCDECPHMRVEPILWSSLDRKGFRDVRLRYENPHHTWRFSMKAPRGVQRSIRVIERLMRAAFADCGYPINKELIAVLLEGHRLRGAFLLSPRRRPRLQNGSIRS